MMARIRPRIDWLWLRITVAVGGVSKLLNAVQHLEDHVLVVCSHVAPLLRIRGQVEEHDLLSRHAHGNLAGIGGRAHVRITGPPSIPHVGLRVDELPLSVDEGGEGSLGVARVDVDGNLGARRGTAAGENVPDVEPIDAGAEVGTAEAGQGRRDIDVLDQAFARSARRAGRHPTSSDEADDAHASLEEGRLPAAEGIVRGHRCLRQDWPPARHSAVVSSHPHHGVFPEPLALQHGDKVANGSVEAAHHGAKRVAVPPLRLRLVDRSAVRAVLRLGRCLQRHVLLLVGEVEEERLLGIVRVNDALRLGHVELHRILADLILCGGLVAPKVKASAPLRIGPATVCHGVLVIVALTLQVAAVRLKATTQRGVLPGGIAKMPLANRMPPITGF
mmetsp:Transcript_81438/g.225540  ORF Transcript_81438/g.225540 Transcript_81438/m.225540 type:complete len:389 (-) Transcript_81438:366-1532(-)